MPISVTSISSDYNKNNPLIPLQTSSVLTNLRYPSDLGSDNKSHYVKFWVKTINPTNFSSLINSVEETAKAAINLKGNANPPTSVSKAVICLYMPDTVDAKYNASYDQLSLTNDLGGLLKGIQMGVTAAQTTGNKGSAVSVDSQLRNALVTYLSSQAAGILTGTGDNIADVALQSQGIALNPQIQMIYRGVDFRDFQLTFYFTPKSAAEAQNIAQIINTFKYHFAPEILTPSGSSGTSGLFFVPPSLFNIEFMIRSKENVYLPRYGDCVLTNIDVNYAPNGFAAHNDGSPVQTQLNLSFREIEIVTKQKIDAGAAYDVAGTSTYDATKGLR